MGKQSPKKWLYSLPPQVIEKYLDQLADLVEQMYSDFSESLGEDAKAVATRYYKQHGGEDK